MKKIFTLLLLAMACSVNMQAQEYNLFDPADVDADGWLWFDDDAKVEKYVGICNEEDYKLDPNGKPIQLVYADQLPDYPVPYIDTWYVGAGSDGEIGSEGAKTGTLLLPVSSGSMTANGGGIALMLPSCKSISMCISAVGSMIGEVRASKDINTSFSNYNTLKGYIMWVGQYLCTAGLHYWEGIETLHNKQEDETDYTLQSDEPIYAYIVNSTAYRELMIHGIKVMTTTAPAGVEEAEAGKDKIFFFNNTISLNEEAQIDVYNVAGVLVESAFATQLSLEDMSKGIYIVKTGNNTRKVAVK